MPTITKLDFVGIPSQDADRSRAFYGETLGLRPGMDAYALVKSSSIIIVTGADGARYSARNCLAGTVSHVLPGAVNSEVRIELPGGTAVAAIITNESRTALGLEPGVAAAALFKASSVIIGVPG